MTPLRQQSHSLGRKCYTRVEIADNENSLAYYDTELNASVKKLCEADPGDIKKRLLRLAATNSELTSNIFLKNIIFFFKTKMRSIFLILN